MNNNLVKYNIAVVGATGQVGETLFEILDERQFPIKNIYALASSKSLGKTVTCGERTVKISELSKFDFGQVDLAFFSAGGDVSSKYVPKATAANCVVIDNTSAFRYESNIPLVVPEVNSSDIKHFEKTNIIANPNCSTIQMVVALKPIHETYGIKRVNVSTYQSVSGSGRSGLKELAVQTSNLLNAKEIEKNIYPEQIAFNCIPQIDHFMDNGYTKEEMKMVWETKKILGDESIQVNATTVRVPVFFGHSEAINVELKTKFQLSDIISLLEKSPGLIVSPENKEGKYPTAAVTAAASDAVYVGRIRRDISTDNGLNLWVVADNVRKGAALNSIQIAEILIAKYLGNN